MKFWLRFCVLTATLGAMACSEDATQLLVVVDSDLRIPQDVSKIVANVRLENGTPIAGYEFKLTVKPENERNFDEFSLPVSFGILPPNNDPDERVEVEVRAISSSTTAETLFERRALTTFIKGRSVTIPMFLARQCRVLQCGENETCTEKGCVPQVLELDEEAEEPISLAEVAFVNRKPMSPSVSLNQIAPTTRDSLLVELVTPSLDADGDFVDYEYEWFKNDESVTQISGSIVPTDLTKKGDQWRVRVTPNDGYEKGEPAEATVEVINSSPKLSLSITSTLARSADDITVSAFVSDADEDETVVTFRWLLDGAEVQKRSVPTTNLVTDVLTFDQTRRGQDWTIEASVSDGTATSSVARVEVQVANAVPSIVAVVLSPQEAYTNTPITATPQGWADADEDLPGYDYEWFVDDVLVPGQSSSELGSEHFVKGQTVYARVYPNDGFGQGRAVASAPVVVQNLPATFAAVSVSPNSGDESTVFSCDTSGWSDPDQDPPGYRFTWFVNGSTSITSATISGASFQRGDEIHCEATAFDGESVGTTRTAAGVLIQNSLPTVAGAMITPSTPNSLDLIEVIPMGWSDLDGDVEDYNYEWFVNGQLVSTDSQLYRVFPSPVVYRRGDRIEVRVTPKDSSGTGIPVMTGPVTIQNTPPVGQDWLSTSPSNLPAGIPQGQVALLPSQSSSQNGVETVFTCEPVFVDPDADPITYTYQWYVNGLSSASTSTLSAPSFARGDQIYCEVVASDGIAMTPVVASPTLDIQNSPPSITNVVVSPSAGNVLNTYSCIPSGWNDADGDTPQYEYLWYRGADPGNVTSTGINTATVSGSAFSKGQWIKCSVQPTDGIDAGDTRLSAEVQIGNVSPSISSASISPSQPRSSQDLIVTPSGWFDQDGDTPLYDYAWFVNGVQITTAIGVTLPADEIARGDQVYARVTPKDDTDFGAPVNTATVTVLNGEPVGPELQISPLAVTSDEDLHCEANTAASDPDGDVVTLSYSWFRDGQLTSVTSSVVTSTHISHREVWTCSATPFDGELYGQPSEANTTVTSTATMRVISISGNTIDGSYCAVRSDGRAICWPNVESYQFPNSDYIRIEEDCPQREDGTLDGCGNGGVYLDYSKHGGNFCGIRTSNQVECVGIPNTPTGLFSKVSVSTFFACGITLSGSVQCWGDTSMAWRSIPSPPLGVFEEVSCNEEVCCSLRPDQTVTCWGDSVSFQPSGHFLEFEFPCGVRVNRGISCFGFDGSERFTWDGTFSGVSPNSRDLCAITEGRGVQCQTRRLPSPHLPVPSAAPVGPVVAATSGNFGCGILFDGEITCWNTFVEPPSGPWEDLAIHEDTACGLRSSGQIECWTGAPHALSNSVYTNFDVGGGHLCGVTQSGSIDCVGENDDNEATPPAGTFVSVTLSDDHSCAIQSDGRGACWGNNVAGQCNVPATSRYIDIEAASLHTCGVTINGDIECWGYNGDGRSNPPSGNNFVEVDVGGARMCARTLDRRVVCWGPSTGAEWMDGGDHLSLSGGKSSWQAGDGPDPGSIYFKESSGCTIGSDGSMFCFGSNKGGGPALVFYGGGVGFPELLPR